MSTTTMGPLRLGPSGGGGAFFQELHNPESQYTNLRMCRARAPEVAIMLRLENFSFRALYLGERKLELRGNNPEPALQEASV